MKNKKKSAASLIISRKLSWLIPFRIDRDITNQ